MTATISSRKPGRLLGAVAVAAAIFLGLAGTAQASPEATRMAGTPYYELRPLSNSNMCLDVAHHSVAHGADVIQGECRGYANQLWRFVSVPGGYYQVRPLSAPGMCLDVAHASLAHAADVIQGTCAPTGGTNQHWAVTFGSEFNQVVARHSTMCLDVAHGSTVHAADVIQGRCEGFANQRWQVRYVNNF